MEYIPAKHIVIKTKDTGWFGIDYNMNIYKGCSHGCIYCDSRSQCYGIEDFDTIRAKENALEVIRDDLRRKVKLGVVGTGSMSDPYNPMENTYQLTRHALELMDAFGFGVAIATKSYLMTRDIDILQSIQEHSPVLCKVTITTTKDELAEKIEPFVSRPSKRLDMIQMLSENGIYAGILLMPVLPFLEDSEENIIAVVERAHQVGAKFIYAAFGMTLRENQREWYYKELKKQFPNQPFVEQYRKQYGNQYQCTSLNARRLYTVFTKKCEEYGILYKMKDIIHSYKQKYQTKQMTVFDFLEK